MPYKFKVGDKVRIKVLESYHWGNSKKEMVDAIRKRTVCTVHYVSGGVDIRLEEVDNWSIHEDDIEFAQRKPTIIIME